MKQWPNAKGYSSFIRLAFFWYNHEWYSIKSSPHVHSINFFSLKLSIFSINFKTLLKVAMIFVFLKSKKKLLKLCKTTSKIHIFNAHTMRLAIYTVSRTISIGSLLSLNFYFITMHVRFICWIFVHDFNFIILLSKFETIKNEYQRFV